MHKWLFFFERFVDLTDAGLSLLLSLLLKNIVQSLYSLVGEHWLVLKKEPLRVSVPLKTQKKYQTGDVLSTS